MDNKTNDSKCKVFELDTRTTQPVEEKRFNSSDFSGLSKSKMPADFDKNGLNSKKTKLKSQFSQLISFKSLPFSFNETISKIDTDKLLNIITPPIEQKKFIMLSTILGCLSIICFALIVSLFSSPSDVHELSKLAPHTPEITLPSIESAREETVLDTSQGITPTEIKLTPTSIEVQKEDASSPTEAEVEVEVEKNLQVEENESTPPPVILPAPAAAPVIDAEKIAEKIAEKQDPVKQLKKLAPVNPKSIEGNDQKQDQL